MANNHEFEISTPDNSNSSDFNEYWGEARIKQIIRGVELGLYLRDDPDEGTSLHIAINNSGVGAGLQYLTIPLDVFAEAWIVLIQNARDKGAIK